MTRVPIPQLAPGERCVDGPAAHYLARVLRLRAGDAFVAFDPASGLESDAVALHADGQAFTARFGPLRESLSRPKRSLTWIHGLAKGDKCDAIVRDATELGATRVVVVSTRRSVVRLDPGRAEARRARWARIAEQAARQCGRSEAPSVDLHAGWAGALASVNDTDARFCLWEKATEPLAPPLFEALARSADLAFACGPEGGLEDDEVALAHARGWAPSSLGRLALRTETVAAAVLGAVAVWSGSFG